MGKFVWVPRTLGLKGGPTSLERKISGLIHTIEVPGLSLNALVSSCADEGLPRRRRQQHVWRAAKEGYAEDLEAWGSAQCMALCYLLGCPNLVTVGK